MSLLHKKFNFEGSSPEIVALQTLFPLPFINKTKLKIDEETIKLIKNKNLHLYQQKERTILCIWFQLFEMTSGNLENAFINCLSHRETLLSLRYSTKKHFIDSLFNEYFAWLNYLKTNNEDFSDKCKPENILKFFMVYNKKLFNLSKINKKTKTLYLKVNPFIGYWLLSKPIRDILELPVNTMFFPDLNIPEIQTIKSLTEIKI